MEPTPAEQSDESQLPQIYWVLMDNQVTPFMIDFLTILKDRLRNFYRLNFQIPALCTQALEMAKPLGPSAFQVSSYTQNSMNVFLEKRELIGENEFKDGLSIWRTLLIDDFGLGNLHETRLHLEQDHNIVCFMLQIPTPLGSTEMEERIFYAWVYLANQLRIPVIGYELLPLETRWTLVPSMLDGIITVNRESYDYLRHLPDVKAPVWLLPDYEGRFFSPTTTHFWSNAKGGAYSLQNLYNLQPDTTVLYIPHNVAMSYEYKKLLRHLRHRAKNLHLMFSIGKDQVRGSFSQEETVELLSKEELPQFASYSFHDLNAPYEMTAADAVVACAHCYATLIAAGNRLPAIILDEGVPPNTRGNKVTVNSREALLSCVDELIAQHKQKTEFARIFLEIHRKKSKRSQ